MAIKPPQSRVQKAQLGLPLGPPPPEGSPSRFATERSAPFKSLLDRAWWSKGMRCGEIECGTGAHTQALHQRLRATMTLGIDTDVNAIHIAKGRQSQGLQFDVASPLDWVPDSPLDLILIDTPMVETPALLKLLNRTPEWLGPEGQLLLHIPRDHAHPLAQQLCQLSSGSESSLLHPQPSRPDPELLVLSTHLHSLGFGIQQVEDQVFTHRLPSPQVVLEWLLEFTVPPPQPDVDPDKWQTFKDSALSLVEHYVGLTRPVFWPSTHLLAWAKLP